MWSHPRNPGISRKKFSILWHSGLLDMFLYRYTKTTLKNTQNSPLYSIFKLTFPEIFKNRSFHFFKFPQNFVKEKISFCGTVWASWRVSSSIPKKPLSKIPKTHLSVVFWSWHSWKFSKTKVPFFSIFSKFFSQLMPAFLGSHHIQVSVFQVAPLLFPIWCVREISDGQ